MEKVVVNMILLVWEESACLGHSSDQRHSDFNSKQCKTLNINHLFFKNNYFLSYFSLFLTVSKVKMDHMLPKRNVSSKFFHILYSTWQAIKFFKKGQNLLREILLDYDRQLKISYRKLLNLNIEFTSCKYWLK